MSRSSIFDQRVQLHQARAAQWLEDDGKPGMMTVDFCADDLTSARAEPE